MAGMVRPADVSIATAMRRCSSPTSCFGIGNRWANRHTGSVDVYTKGRKFVHVDIEPTQIGRVFAPDLGIVSDAGAALKMLHRRRHASGRRRASCATGRGWAKECQRPQEDHAAQDAFRPGAAEAAARLRGDEQGVRPRHHAMSRRSACRRSPARSSCMSTSRATGSIAARPARSAGRCRRRSACAPPIRTARSWRCRATTTSSS